MTQESFFLYATILLIILFIVALALIIYKKKITQREHTITLLKEEKKDLIKQHLNDKLYWLNSLHEGFLEVDENNTIISLNNLAQSLLKNNAKLEGKPLFDVLHNPALEKSLRQVLSATEKTSITLILPPAPSAHKTQGNETAWQLSVRPVIKKPKYKQLIFSDITHGYQTDQVRKDFVANASHELRTPLTIIIGYIEGLLEEDILEESPKQAKKFLHIMHKHGQRLERIVDDMLMISKLESSQTNILKEEEFSLNECILDVFSRLELIKREKEAQLTLAIPQQLTLFGDKFYWTQIFFNLIENALKQNLHPGLHISVGGELTDKELQLWVSDNGIGIPQAHIPYIFKRFYRVETHHSQEIKGTGLGLSIVKRAVESHQGSITVKSLSGIETRFTISLPKERLHSPKVFNHEQ